MSKPIEIISEKKIRVMLHTSDGEGTLFIRLAESHEALRWQLRLADGTIDRLIERNEREIRRLADALREVRHRAAPYPDGAGRELNEEAFAEIQQIADRALAEMGESDD